MTGDRRPGEGGPRRGGIRSRTAAMGDEVAPVELLFDLVFVFAISQLSEHLLEHLTWRGALERAVLLMAVFGVWSLTSFAASMPSITRRAASGDRCAVRGPPVRCVLQRRYHDRIRGVAVPVRRAVLACNLGVVFFYVFAVSSPQMRQHGQSMLVWAVPSPAP